MLVLSRKKNESIVIDNNITIVVVEIRGDKVRLGVEAPKDVPVHRREVYEAIKRNEQVESLEGLEIQPSTPHVPTDPVEYGHHLKKLIEKSGLPRDEAIVQIAGKIEKPITWIHERLALCDAHDSQVLLLCRHGSSPKTNIT